MKELLDIVKSYLRAKATNTRRLPVRKMILEGHTSSVSQNVCFGRNRYSLTSSLVMTQRVQLLIVYGHVISNITYPNMIYNPTQNTDKSNRIF